MFESEALEFLAHRLHAHAAGERRINVQRLGRDTIGPILRQELERAHVVQTVGQLDEQDADVLRDRQEKLAEILGLRRLARHDVEFLDLRETLDQPTDFRTKKLVDFLAGAVRILDRVVQDGGDDGGVVELEIGEDGGDFERMGEIGIARCTGLLPVRTHRIDIGAVQKILVGVRIIAPHPFDEFVLPHHR